MHDSTRKMLAMIFIGSLAFSGGFFVLLPSNSAASTLFSQPTEIYNANSDLKLKLNYTLSYTSFDTRETTLQIWFSRINNWTETQNSSLKAISSDFNIESPNTGDSYVYDPTDIYNNSYDYFKEELDGFGGDQRFKITYQYEIDMEGREWIVPESLNLSEYDTASELYQLYTREQPLCEITSPEIQNITEHIVGENVSIVNISRTIYDYVIDTLTYQVQLEPEPKGALQTVIDGVGDCSEFSSLMVCLLRASGIPARKVLGLGLVDGDISAANPKYDIKTGDSWNYTTEDNNIPGHAWVQYYVPNQGWISCDPTWGQALKASSETLRYEYFNKIDYLHLITSMGEWYGEGIDPELVIPGDTGLGEFPYQWIIRSTEGGSSPYSYDFELVFYVEDAMIGDVSTTNDFSQILLYSGIVVAILILLYFTCVRKSKPEY